MIDPRMARLNEYFRWLLSQQAPAQSAKMKMGGQINGKLTPPSGPPMARDNGQAIARSTPNLGIPFLNKAQKITK